MNLINPLNRNIHIWNEQKPMYTNKKEEIKLGLAINNTKPAMYFDDITREKLKKI